jgi:hypothetical protein
VAVYGGFASTETQLSQRDWTGNVTTLSGDIGTAGDTSDNSYHVVIGATGATLDGFSISGGNANENDESPNSVGGGIYNNASNPTLTNLIISGNNAIEGGGIINSSSSPVLTNVTVTGNTAFAGGGGVYNRASSNPVLTNVIISGNSADFGGGIYSINSSPVLTNVIISGNSASTSGGGIFNGRSDSVFTNVTISGNRASSTGGGLLNNISNPQIRNSIVWGNRVGTSVSSLADNSSTPVVSYSIVEGGYSGTGNLSSDPEFVSAADAANAPTTSGDYHILPTSPTIDAGNNSVADTGSGTAPIVDMGAYEHQANLSPTLDQPADLVTLEDASLQTVSLTGIGAGSGESQTISITAVSSNPALIPNPVISHTSPNTSGSLSFTPVANTNGSATITITVQDSGGTDNSGVDTVTRSFSVTVTAVNDAPSFTAGANQSVAANAVQQTMRGWASGFGAGPANESGQTVLEYTVVSNTAPELFTVAPSIDISGALIYTPKLGARGTATIGVMVRDSGGTANGGIDTSTVRTFTITVGGSYRLYLPFILRS